MQHNVDVRSLQKFDEHELQGLSDVLIDCVEGGASVSFMWPMTRGKALAFWRDAAASVARGERIVLAAYDDRNDRRNGASGVRSAREPAAPCRRREDARASTRSSTRRRRGAAPCRRTSRSQLRQDAARPRHRLAGRRAAVHPARLAAVRPDSGLRADAGRRPVRYHSFLQVTTRPVRRDDGPVRRAGPGRE